MMEYCYSPKPKEFYTIETHGPGQLPQWLWNLAWLSFPILDAWEAADKSDYDLVWKEDGMALRQLCARARNARDHEPMRAAMVALTAHPSEFLQLWDACEVQIGDYLLQGLLAPGDDPDSVIITRARVAAERIDAANKRPPVEREGNVIHAHFGNRSSA